MRRRPMPRCRSLRRARRRREAKTPASGGGGGGDAPAANAPLQIAAQGAPTADGYEPVWIETPECTACDECTTLAPKVFAYNAQKLAIVGNPKGGKFADLGKAG